VYWIDGPFERWRQRRLRRAPQVMPSSGTNLAALAIT
jgi:hypothetical protein